MQDRPSRRLAVTTGLVVVALLVVVPTALFLAARAWPVVAPRYAGKIEVVYENTARKLPVLSNPRIGEVDADGVWLDVEMHTTGTWVVEHACSDPFFAVPFADCRARLSSRLLGPQDVRVTRLAGGHYRIRAIDGDEDVVVRIAPTNRLVLHYTHLASPRLVPTAIGLLSVLALAFALVRVRLAVAYSRRICAWNERTLTEGGMLQDESGATIGTVASGARVPPGPVLVAPPATRGSSVYRELPIIARSEIAAGSHAQWERGTALRLRDARTLSVLATATSLVAIAVQVLAP